MQLLTRARSHKYKHEHALTYSRLTKRTPGATSGACGSRLRPLEERYDVTVLELFRIKDKQLFGSRCTGEKLPALRVISAPPYRL